VMGEGYGEDSSLPRTIFAHVVVSIHST
jgi:hypothetical protein